MSFETQLQTYAKLLVHHALNVQPGQVVNIGAEAVHRDLVVMVAEEAYRRGAKYVDVSLDDSRVGRARVELGAEGENLDFVPDYVTTKLEATVNDNGANLRIIGSENPDILADQNPKRINRLRMANYKAAKYFYDEGIGKSKVHWTVAAAATPAWGRKVFPELDGAEAEAALWKEILRICRADQDNCLELWSDHNRRLHDRGRRMTEMKIETLHFTGPGTDLSVGLSRKAVFKGGTDQSPRGVDFEPNIPTEEVFTTPDNRLTTGTARATRPFLINGKLIEGLELVFEGGEVKSFTSTEGGETFQEYIDSDPGGKRLGEVALVGIDSPVYQSGKVFQEILFDENAACHIAVGSAYKFCLDGGETMSASELAAVGCNESSVHTDMMISSEEVSVVARCYDGSEVELISAGQWAV